MTTYATLKTDVAAFIAEDDLTLQIPSFIRLAEANIRRDVRVRDMEQTAELVVSSRSTALPSGFLSMRSLTIQDATLRTLNYMTPEKIREDYEWNDGGSPSGYTIEGGNLIVSPVPSSAVTLDIVYVKAYAALSADVDTNWVLTNAYDLYLFATLYFAAIYLEDAELETKYSMLYTNIKEALNREQKLSRIGGSSRVRYGVSTP